MESGFEDDFAPLQSSNGHNEELESSPKKDSEQGDQNLDDPNSTASSGKNIFETLFIYSVGQLTSYGRHFMEKK